MNSSHKQQSISAVKWALLDRFGSQVILLINTLLLARLLTPHDFGLIGILYIFMNLSSAFVDSGMGGGLIRKQDLTDTDCSTFFIFNVAVGVTFYVLLFLAAPAIAHFYKEPIVIMLLRILGITVIINSLGLIQKVLLVKSLKLKYVTRASLIASFLSTAIAIVGALKGMGVWSLLLLQICQSFFNTVFLWIFSKWVPKAEFSKASFKELYSFGLGLFLTALLNILFANIYAPIIGKFFSVTYSGLFYQAKRLYEVPILTISSVVDSITYPILVKYQEDRKELSENYQKIVKLLIFVVIPIIVSISILSNHIVLVLLGKKWMASGELLRIMSFSGIFLILETINGSILKIEGRTKLIFKLELIKKTIIIANIFIFSQFGLTALVYGMVINAMISFGLNQYFSKIRISSYKNLLMLLGNGALMAVIIIGLTLVVHNPLLALLIGGAAGGLSYLIAAYAFKMQEQKWLYMIITRNLKPAA